MITENLLSKPTNQPTLYTIINTYHDIYYIPNNRLQPTSGYITVHMYTCIWIFIYMSIVMYNKYTLYNIYYCTISIINKHVLFCSMYNSKHGLRLLLLLLQLMKMMMMLLLLLLLLSSSTISSTITILLLYYYTI